MANQHLDSSVFWSRPSLIPCAVAIAVLLFFSTPAWTQNLRLTLAAQPASAGVVSTRDGDNVTITVMSGSQVSFAQSSGRDYQLEASGGFFWTQVQELPRDAESIVLAPTLNDDGSIEVLVDVAQKTDRRLQNYRSTVVAQAGEWLQLLGPDYVQSRGTKVYGTQAAARETLFLLVETP